VLRVGDLDLDPATRRARRGDAEISLSTKELHLLEVFMRHPGELLARYRPLEGAWDRAYEHRSNVIDVYVRYLREKIDRPFGAETIDPRRRLPPHGSLSGRSPGPPCSGRPHARVRLSSQTPGLA
jgi:two-component system OmpR family response regulator